MAIIHGKGGKVMVTGTPANLENVVSWSGDFKVKHEDISVMGGAGAVARMAGLVDASFTVECKRDPSATQQNAMITNALAGTTTQFQLFENSTKKYQLMALIDFSVNVDVNNVVKLTIKGDNADGNLPTYS